MARIAIGSDHAGYDLKAHLVTFLTLQGHQVDDQGTHSTDSVDYPDICAAVGRTVLAGDADRVSLVFFHQPNYDAMIECLPTVLEPGETPRYEPISSGDHLYSKFVKQTSMEVA